jgi:ribonuclease D
MGVPTLIDLALPSAPNLVDPKNAIHWIDTPAALRSVCAELVSADVIGLDVETATDFGTLCLIQIGTRNRTYLIDPFAVADLSPLREVFSRSGPIKVIHNARFERRVLAAVGLEIQSVFDSLEVSRRVRGREVLGGHGLAMVCERELGATLDKGEQTSNWSRRPLDARQLHYAALDAEVLIRLYEALRSQLPPMLPGIDN